MRAYTVIATALLLAGGCTTNTSQIAVPDPAAAIQTADGLVRYTDDRVELLQVTATAIRPRTLLAADDTFTVRTVVQGAAKHEVYALTAPTNPRDPSQFDALRVLSPSREPVVFPLSAPFTGIRFSPDGRFCLLYHEQTADALFNANEIAIVDLLAAPGGTNPRTITADLSGSTIEDVYLLDPIADGDGTSIQLAALVTDGALFLVDLLSPALNTTTVRTKTSTDPRSIVLDHIEVHTGPGGVFLIGSAPRAQELFFVSLEEADTGEAGLDARINLLDAGTGVVSDFAVVEADGTQYVVVADGGYDVVVYELATARSAAVPLPYPCYTIDAVSMEDDHTVLLFPGPNRTVAYLDSTDIARGEEGLSYVDVDNPPTHLWLVNETVAVFGSDRGTTRLRIVDLADLVADGDTGVSLLAPDELLNTTPLAYEDRLFFAAEQRVYVFDRTDGSIQTVELDEPGVGAYLFAQQGVLVVLHATPTGRATLLPVSHPDRDHAMVRDGFNLAGILDEKGAL